MKATILIGLPMSGKSTYAKLNKGNSVIIDCDDVKWRR
jgi:predicted kinase